jgi:hypothetical protein
MQKPALIACAAVVLVLAVPAAVWPGPAEARPNVTKGQAYRTARVCLLNHGARLVGRHPDGGGFAIFKTGSTFWAYKTLFGQVSSVIFYFAGLTKSTERIVKSCVTKGI